MLLTSHLHLSNKEESTIASYTADATFFPPIPTSQDDIHPYRIVPSGMVVAFDPATAMVIPNYPSFVTYTTSYASGVLGVIYRSTRLGTEMAPVNRDVGVVIGGVIDPAVCLDEGQAGVLESTKTALSGRVSFLHER